MDPYDQIVGRASLNAELSGSIPASAKADRLFSKADRSAKPALRSSIICTAAAGRNLGGVEKSLIRPNDRLGEQGYENVNRERADFGVGRQQLVLVRCR